MKTLQRAWASPDWTALLAVFGVAFALRLYAIDRQSLWYDEGLLAALAARAPQQIVRDALMGVHPPLYHLTLHGWAAVFGTSEAALRSLSALCGALTAAVVAVLGHLWFGRASGAAAGLVFAISPLAVHYGQDVRMYALATLLVALMLVPPDASAGLYTLVAGLYDPATGERLRLAGGADSLVLARIWVIP